MLILVARISENWSRTQQFKITTPVKTCEWRCFFMSQDVDGGASEEESLPRQKFKFMIVQLASDEKLKERTNRMIANRDPE